jgi:hypothetical protein
VAASRAPRWRHSKSRQPTGLSARNHDAYSRAHRSTPPTVVSADSVYSSLMEKPNLYAAVALGMMLVASIVRAGESQRTIRKDVFLENTYKIYEDGHQVGTVRPDPLLKDQYEVQDQRGRPVGERKDPFLDDQWEFKGNEAGDDP